MPLSANDALLPASRRPRSLRTPECGGAPRLAAHKAARFLVRGCHTTAQSSRGMCNGAACSGSCHFHEPSRPTQQSLWVSWSTHATGPLNGGLGCSSSIASTSACSVPGVAASCASHNIHCHCARHECATRFPGFGTEYSTAWLRETRVGPWGAFALRESSARMSDSPTSANSETYIALASAKLPSAVARWPSTRMHPMRRRVALARSISVWRRGPVPRLAFTPIPMPSWRIHLCWVSLGP